MTEPTTPPLFAVCWDPVRRRFTGHHGAGLVPVPPLEGYLSLGEADLSWAADDFGGTVRRRPLAVLRPRSEDDVATIIAFAARQGITVVPRAQGHSTAGQAQAVDGIVVDMTSFTTVHHVADDRVVVDAGARWSEVLAATLERDTTPPVLTDYLELSVGGTLSVGGLGGASHHHGAQTDHVLELEAVTPEGTRRTCSPTSAPHLFDALRGGRGRHGVILRATLRLIPAPSHARTHLLSYGHLGDFLADQRLLMTEGRFDHLEGQVKFDDGWKYRIDATAYTSVPDTELLAGLRHRPVADEVTVTSYRDFLNRMAEDVAMLRALGAWQQPHPWVNFLLADDSAEDVVADTLSELTPEDIGETGLILIYPLARDRLATPRLHLPDTSVIFLFALLRAAWPGSSSALARMIEHNRAVERRVLASRGVTYLGESTISIHHRGR